jgi:GNAT superfamily N-acetyltransferase
VDRQPTAVKVVIQSAGESMLEALGPLLAESERAGWRFVRRLADEYRSGANRFERPGERLFVAVNGRALVGVCGLNVDPYAAELSVGRVRRLYVAEAFRRFGVGARLVRAVVSAAGGRFARLRLRTENPEAGRLYERLGFRPVADQPNCTHLLELAPPDSPGT